MTEIIKCVHGHTSPETAFVFPDWPFGFRLRCQRRVWLEFKKGKGFRFVSQTTNPKRGDAWNKPHASTYSDVGVMIWIKSAESPTGMELTWTGLSLYDGAEKVAKFEADYAEAIAADENLRKEIKGIKLFRRISDARMKLNRIFENAVRHLEGDFNCEEFVKLFEGDHAFGNAIADKWMRQTEGVGVIKDWVRNAFKEVMDEYHLGWEQAKATKPDGYKMLSPRMDTIQEGDLRYFPPYIKEWTVLGSEADFRGLELNGASGIGAIVQSGGGFWARKKTE